MLRRLPQISFAERVSSAVAKTNTDPHPLNEARDALGLRSAEWGVALERQLFKVRYTDGGPVLSAREFARLTAAEGRAEVLNQVQLLHTEQAAQEAGCSQDRLRNLARLGFLVPARRYDNPHQGKWSATDVWLYARCDVQALAAEQNALLRGVLPKELRGRLDRGEDVRRESLQRRRLAQELRLAAPGWPRAAKLAGLVDGQVDLTAAELYRIGTLDRGLPWEVTEQPFGDARSLVRELQREVQVARRKDPAPELVSAAEVAERLGCLVEGLPVSLAGGAPEETVVGLESGPPSWLSGLRLDAIAGRVAAALQVPRQLVRSRVKSGQDPERVAERWTERPPAWLEAWRRETARLEGHAQRARDVIDGYGDGPVPAGAVAELFSIPVSLAESLALRDGSWTPARVTRAWLKPAWELCTPDAIAAAEDIIRLELLWRDLSPRRAWARLLGVLEEEIPAEVTAPTVASIVSAGNGAPLPGTTQRRRRKPGALRSSAVELKAAAVTCQAVRRADAALRARERWAAAFSVPVQAVPESAGTVSDSAVAAAVAAPPDWLITAGWQAGEGPAMDIAARVRAEAARRAAVEHRAREQAAQRGRQAWAKAFEIPVGAVPDDVPAPADKAFRAAARQVPDWLERAGWRPGQGTIGQALERERLAKEAKIRVQATVPRGIASTPRIVLHLGPTNSGKTHAALQALELAVREGRSGVYAAPLRQLAHQAYEDLAGRLGEDLVGLRTGEERVNDTAPLVCCTPEAADRGRDVLVVDECHWLGDSDRGPAWTQLLLSGTRHELHLIAASEAEPLLRQMAADAECVEAVHYERRAKLTYVAEPFKAGTLPAGTALIAFSRKAVLALHRELIAAGRTATVVYGAMPPEARREQVRRVREAEVDIVVSTDALGHGINLPLACVAFAETNKYDGTSRRSLHRWEAAQIAGRAGRFGRGAGDGIVGTFTSRMPGFDAKPKLVKAAVGVANGDAMSDLRLDRARLAPTWQDLGRPPAEYIPAALGGWREQAALARAGKAWLITQPTGQLEQTWRLISGIVHRAGGDAWPHDGLDVWRLLTLGVDSTRPVYADLVRAALLGAPLRHRVRDEGKVARFGLKQAEDYAALMRDLNVAVNAFGGVLSDLKACEASAAVRFAAARVSEIIASGRPLSDDGKCDTCGKPCAPWFNHCDRCHERSFDYWY
jgi:ATP-dependent RNA helicase SUPV3L1/SUV3